MKQLTASVTTATTVKGVELKYVAISDGAKTVFVQIGEKNFAELAAMENNVPRDTDENKDQLKIPLEEVVKHENEKSPNPKQERADEIKDATKVDNKQGTRR